MKLKPLFDKVVVQLVEQEEKTKSGFILPSSAKEKPQTAKIVAVGEGGMIDGNDVKMIVKVGDIVVFSKYSGTEFKIDGEDFIIIRQSDILALVQK